LEEFQWAVSNARVPAVTDSANVTMALIHLDRFQEAKNLLEASRQKRALDNSQTEQRYWIAFSENDSATMEQLSRETPADRFGLGLQQRLAFYRGDSGRLRAVSETLVHQEKRALRRENTANELARQAVLESYWGNPGQARRLCRQADEANSDSNLALG